MSTARPGTALRSLRKRNRWTLTDVSERTGIPSSTLSRIENDQMSPTYDLLLRLSKGLAIDLTQLLSMATSSPDTGADQPGRRSVNRREEGETVQMTNHTLWYLSTDLLNKQVTPIRCEYRARSLAEFGPFMRHEGEEFLYVIDGELELHTDCYAPLVLKAGESVYFDSRMGHAYIARGEQPCHALSMCTTPSAEHKRQAQAATGLPSVNLKDITAEKRPADRRPGLATRGQRRSRRSG
jgi:transcriptional regulator with XRE-family HTH domain